MRARSIRRNAREGGVRRGPLRGELGYEEEHVSERQKDGENRYSIWRDKRKISITDANNITQSRVSNRIIQDSDRR